MLSKVVRDAVAQAMGLSEDASRVWVTWLAAAHDIGKATPRFQGQDDAARSRLKAQGLAFPVGSNAPHGDLSTAILIECLTAGRPIGPVNPSTARTFARLVGGHHGTFPPPGQRPSADTLGDGRWSSGRDEILSLLADLLGIRGVDVPKLDVPPHGGPAMWLAGLVSVADWIGSNTDFFPYHEDEIDVGRYFGVARERASNAIEHLCWQRQGLPTAHLRLTDLFPTITGPRPLQMEVAALAAGGPPPRLTIIESPMGEGKTEAALFLHYAGMVRGSRSGCYFALPTQATSNQMFRRVRDFIATLHPGEPVNLHLLHGQASLSADYEQLKLGAIYDAPDNQQGVLASEWFTPRKRGLLSPYAVGTIDQALMAVLQTRHVFVRLMGLAGKTVVLDEVHAYDAYMSTILERLLSWLAALDCNVVLLSATLPRARREGLIQAFTGRSETYDSCPYPRLTVIEGERVRTVHVPASPDRQRTLATQWITKAQVPELLDQLLVPGGSAAFVCNTVASAQMWFRELAPLLAARGIEVHLFHARFPFGQRDQIERDVLRRYGRENGVDRPSASLLIATQVIEQSLDIDFDLMLSEPAPIDLLLQRAGRLHRHPRTRPPHLTAPTLLLLDPDNQDDAAGDDPGIYEPYILRKTATVLRGRENVRLPEDIEPLIEAVYGEPDPSRPEEPALAQARVTMLARRNASQQHARTVLIHPPHHEDLLTASNLQLNEDDPKAHESIRAATRETKPTVGVVFCYGRPEHPSLEADLSRPVSLNDLPDVPLTRELLTRSVVVSHQGVVRQLVAQPAPPGWSRHPMLRFMRTVSLDNAGRALCGGYELILDPRLGLVIQPVPRSQP